MKKLLIIDTFNFLHRAYHALPTTFRDPNGEPTNAVYGVTSMLINLFDQIRPDYALAAVDSREPTLRHEEFTGYKAHRRPMEDDLSSQIPKVFEVIDSFGIKRVALSGYEADDVIGTATHKFVDEDVQIVIVSNDRDLWQLVSDKVTVMIPSNKGPADWIGPKEVEARMGLIPAKIPDYKGLRGDPSDNIPGVYGVGDKAATKLLLEFGSVEGIYEHLGDVIPASLQKKLAASAEEAVMSKQLATIVMDAPFDLTLPECTYVESDKEAVKTVLEKYNFKSLIRRLGFVVGGSELESKKKNSVPESQMSLF